MTESRGVVLDYDTFGWRYLTGEEEAWRRLAQADDEPDD